MAKKVYVDANGKSVGEGSAEAAFVFNEGDDRLEKFRKAATAKQTRTAAKPTAADDDGTTERVAKR